jgi:hypothetical protein
LNSRNLKEKKQNKAPGSISIRSAHKTFTPRSAQMAANQPMAARAQLASPLTHRVTRAQVPHARNCAAHTSISLDTDPWGQPLALSCAYANVFVVPAMWAPCSRGWVGLAAAAHWDPCVRCLLPYLRMVLTTDCANHAVANQI